MSKRKHKKNQTEQKNQPPSKSFLERFGGLGIFVIVALTYLVFAGVVNNDFINYQDNSYILENDLVQDISSNVFAEPVENKYQPISILSLAFNYQSAKLDAETYHWTNLILHLVNIVLVFYFLYLLSQRKLLVGFIGALIFAVHPMNSEAVAWLSARSVLVYGLFILLSLICYLKQEESKKPWWQVAAILTYLLALLSNPAAIAFPFVLLAIHYWKGGKIDKAFGLKWVQFWAISLGFLAMAFYFQQVGNMEAGLVNTLMNSTYAFGLYLLKFFVPFQLSIIHPSPLIGATPTLYSVSPVIFLAFIGLTFWAMRTARVWAFALFFFAANIFWFMPFLQNSESIISESNAYIAYLGFAFAVAHTIHHFLQSKEDKQKLIGKSLAGIGILAILGFAYLSHERVTVWKDNFNVWEDAIQKYPNAAYVAYAYKGDYYRYQKNYSEALNQYNQSVAINPNYGAVYHRRALVHHELEDLKAAESDYLRAVEFGEGRYMSYANLCKLHRMEGDYEQAMKECNAAIQGDDFEQKHNVYLQRGTMLALAKNYKGALADYNEYIKHDTEEVKAYRWRAIAHFELEDYKAAMKDIEFALNLNGSDAISYMYRYKIHKLRGNKKEANLDSIRAKTLGAPM